MRTTKPNWTRLAGDESSEGPRAYATVGLDEGTLRQLLIDEADKRAGETIGVAFPGRGAVLWHSGDLSVLGPAGERVRELRDAVEALVEGVDVASPAVVEDLLLTMGGARLVVHRLIVGEPDEVSGR
jgi:hypothetical protein